jgi:hypothetical protein
MPTAFSLNSEQAARYHWLMDRLTFHNERDMGPGRHWAVSFYVPHQSASKSPEEDLDYAMRHEKC